MRILNLILAFLVLGMNSYGQADYTLEGSITDHDGTALYGAHIELSPGQKLTSTDEQGQFRFVNINQGEYQLTVSYIGYETKIETVVIDKNTFVSLELRPGQILTDKIVVEGLRASVNTGTTFENIGKKDIEKENTGQDLPFLMQMTPSVVVTSDAGHGVGYTGMRIRGSDATRINATINGIPYNDAESQGTFWVNLPDFASSVESIQIQRGVGTSTNGAGAFGASLNINTNSLNRDSYVQLNNSLGSFNTMKNTIALGSGLLKDRFVLDARLSRINSDGYIDRATSDLKSLYLSGGWYGNKHILRFNIIAGKEKTYQAWNGIPQDLLSENRTFNEFTYHNQTDNYSQTHYQLHYSNQISSKFNWGLSGNYTRGLGYYEEYKEDQSFEDYGLSELIFNDTVINETDLVRRRWLDNHFYGLTARASWEPREFLNIDFGGGFYQYQGDHYGTLVWSEYASNAFVDDKYYFNDALKNDGNAYLKATWDAKKWTYFLDLQLRSVYYSFLGIDRNGDALEQDASLLFFNPKFGLTYHVSSKSQWYASLAKGSREPNRDDYTEAPEELRPDHEELYDLEAGYRFQNKRHRFTGNLYYMKYNNQLVLNGEINDVGTYVRTNVKDSYRLGIELADQYAVTSQWQVGGNIAWSLNRIPNFNEYIDVYDAMFNYLGQEKMAHENTTIAFSPSVVAAFQTTYSPVEFLSLAWESKYVSRQYLDNTSNKSRSIDPFSFTNVRIEYSDDLFSLENVVLALDLKNIFNSAYETNGYTYGYVLGNERADFNYYYPQAGFHFMISLNIHF
ncbi:TonB-dependent receptor [Membranicola marinus]|uniref:TonB-dependent receptor n=1 Tax=Membranihabitans marinus TaxID=1227546 RepID=A0A953HKF5_9BACT|nr:TonB-dependent receptor [Membranihabitans marinus]MBY5957322.1 TonB-dependent receptor [Membranihabitans marinus]